MRLTGHAIAFDLDGTLVDTAPDLVQALNVCLHGSGLSAINVAQVRPLIGQGARALIERAFMAAGQQVETEDVDARLDVFLRHYRQNIAGESRPFEGALEALDAFSRAGAHLSICTNKPRALTLRLLEALDLSQRFDRIVCPDDVRERKPRPGHVLAAIAPVPPGKALMVGDSIHDVQGAKNAKVAAIVFSHGYSVEPVHELGADRVLDHFAELPAAVFAHFGLA